MKTSSPTQYGEMAQVVGHRPRATEDWVRSNVVHMRFEVYTAVLVLALVYSLCCRSTNAPYLSALMPQTKCPDNDSFDERNATGYGRLQDQ